SVSVFFFSSRRRHTRFSRDWSSDVCSSDLFDRRRRLAVTELSAIEGVEVVEPEGAFYVFPSFEGVLGRDVAGRTVASTLDLAEEIGRASCREREQMRGGERWVRTAGEARGM